MAGAEFKNFAAPDEVLEFPMGRGEIVSIGGGKVLRIILEPGWRWSEHLKPTTGTELCEAPHFQYVISGRMAGTMADGTGFEGVPGDVIVLPPGHDAWVVGDEPVEAIDWGGAHVWGRASE
jgi:quercetin dioxygenase-like cupin family protein